MTDDQSSAPERLAAAIMAEIKGRAPGALLPSVRELQKRYQVSPVTVTKALSLLKRQGVIYVRPGQGAFLVESVRLRADHDVSWQSLVLGARVANALEDHMAAVPPDEIAFNAGYLSADLQPLKELRRYSTTAASRAAAWGQIPTEGLAELRTWFAEETGAGYRSHDVVITHGGQSALSTIFRAIARPGAAILVESPTYLGALAAAQGAGLRAFPVPIDEHGVRPGDLEAAFAATGAVAFYCQPLHANPSGVTLSLSRRAAVIEAVAAANAFVIEDDSTRYLHFAPGEPAPTLASLDPSRVVLIRSMTKPTVPSLRVAAIICKGPIRERVKSIRVSEDMFTGGFAQELLLELVSSASWPRHLARLREALAEKCDIATRLAAERLGEQFEVRRPGGGLHLWVKLPEALDENEFVAQAVRRQVHISPGEIWFPAERPAGYVRLSYGGVSIGEMDQAFSVLAENLKSHGRRARVG
jgi:DNA-binding transcriptional MocR family regulator